MTWDHIAGNWKHLMGQVKQKWSKFTEDDLDVIAGRREQLAELLQKHYGIAKEQAEKDADEFVQTLKK